jgi:hypothetical protein
VHNNEQGSLVRSIRGRAPAPAYISRRAYVARWPNSLIYAFNLYPLRVLKHVVCMFFSLNDSQFKTHQPDLVRFVLDRDPRSFQLMRIYAFHTFSDRPGTLQL